MHVFSFLSSLFKEIIPPQFQKTYWHTLFTFSVKEIKTKATVRHLEIRKNL